MSKPVKNTRKLAGILILACGLAILAAPTPASAVEVNWRVFGSLIDSDDLAEAFGGGIRVSFPVHENWEFDIAGSYYEDFKNRFEDNTETRRDVELSTIPIDFGLTWTRNGESGFQFGLGATYGYMDINDLNIEGFEGVRITGDANDEFGGYLKIGYQAGGGFFGEIFYRLLEVSVDDVQIDGIPAADFDIQLDGFSINLGWRF